MPRTRLVFVLGACLAWAIPALAKPTATQKCEAAKLKLAGKDAGCRAAAVAKTTLGGTGDVTKCDLKLTDGFAKLEAKAACPPSGDGSAIAATIAGYVVNINRAIAHPFGRFTDNGDGTVTDNQTGLQWEKKVETNLAHFPLNNYSWSATCGGTAPDGTLFTDFLATLNDAGTGCFAGHCDWRIPTIAELETIAEPPGVGSGCATVEPYATGCVDEIFGPSLLTYWSSTTDERYADQAIVGYYLPVEFMEANLLKCDETVPPHGVLFLGGRAVRGTSTVPLCQPATTCATQTAGYCDAFIDDCGDTRYCGCDPPQTCGGAGVPGQCGCTPNCAGKTCGDDGCGGSCGTCTAPRTCGGGGVANQCGCTDNGLACSNAGRVCGTVVNNCGQQVSCGTCPGSTPKCCIDSCVCNSCVCP